jgi:predicted DNA-binding transcriptional regulator AlpA
LAETIPDIEPLLDAKEVRAILKCSLPAVYKMAERNQLSCVRWECLGEGTEKRRTTIRFKRSDVLEFIQSNYQPAK